MPVLNVKILGLNDPPAFPEEKEAGDQLYFGKVGVLEGGMESGATSLYFILKDKDNVPYYAEMSLVNLEQLTAVAKGADQRFKDLKKAREN